MKKNNIIILALTVIFVFVCVLTFTLVSKKGTKETAILSYSQSTAYFASSKENFFLTSTSAATTVPPVLQADNHIETQPSVTAQASQSISEVTYTTQTASSSTTQIVQNSDISDKMCVITASAADTWQGKKDDCTYIPYYSTLTRGTMDYVVGTSSKFDDEEGTTRSFYELSCGRKVLQSDVSLVPKTDLGDNTVTVLSSTPKADGELTIVLSEKWRVPYLFSFSGQNYYSSYGKNFFVNDFTARTISFTFYHTTSFAGTVNTAGSSVVSSASWSADASNKTVTLTLPLFGVGRFYGYSANYDSNGNFVITIHNKPKTLSGSVVMLDPGHGGKDCGSLDSSKTVREAEINLKVAMLTKAELERRGATVYITRDSNVYLSLEQRKELAYSAQPDVFVSLHCDADEKGKPMGTSAFYYKPMSKALSQLIHDEIVSVYNNSIYAGQTDKLSQVDRKCKYHPFSVTRIEDCPSVLIEIGFITNEDDFRAISDSSNQQKIAVAVANGIERYITSY